MWTEGWVDVLKETSCTFSALKLFTSRCLEKQRSLHLLKQGELCKSHDTHLLYKYQVVDIQ